MHSISWTSFSRALFAGFVVLSLQACTQTNTNVSSKVEVTKPNIAASQFSSVATSKPQAYWQKAWQAQLDRLEAARKKRLALLSRNNKTKEKKVVVRQAAPASSGRSRYDTLIRKYAKANGVPIRLAHAVVFVESSYRANARGGVGEIGLMQLRLATARGMGYRGSAKGLYNPETNIKYGMKYLGKAYRLGGGSICGAILRYNAGHGATRMNPTSRRYCRRVQRLI